VGTLGLMVKAYGGFDESMTRSLAIMGDVSAAMRDKMAKTAKQLSTETTFAAKDLAEAYFFLASAGMSAEASVSALAPVARFAQAGTFDLAQATDLLTDAQTALGLSSKNVAENEENLIRVSDVLVGANTLANASVLQFSESLTTKAAAALVNVNKEVEEGVAVLAAYADKGVKGRLAGTRLTMMLNGLFAATRENKKAWDEAGISLFEADGSMRQIADIIGDMEGYLGAMTVKQREAALATLGFNVRTKDSILTLMGSSEKIRGWTEDLKKMGGITKTVADKQMEAFNAKMTVAKNTIVGAAMSIGKSLAPMIVKLTAQVKTIAERISAWIEKHPKLTAVIAKVALGIGALMTVLGPLAMMLPGIIAALPALGAAFSALLGPIGAVALGATAVGAALGKLISDYEKKQDAEIDAIVNASTAHAKYHAIRKKLIADEIVTIEEWSEIFNKHGRSYKRVLVAISKLPEYGYIKDHLDAIIKKHEEVEKSIKDIPPTLSKTIGKFDMWATTIANIFHATSVRAAEMRGAIETKIKLPPVAIDIPKMSLEDFSEWYKKWEADLMKDWPKTWKESFQMALGDAALFTSSLSSL
ncbi:MAG: phage tail tape measure protein, partial [Desulfobacterales bacterium]|nr:phage tail tape measure protein [Desulfobacterales bacterium]